ncbi:MAG: hypothetical protein KFF73_08515 [Cyclobacteriaceae bacterium]|nr:hypothetical protein [Cyclobacteriaceae bacterium]
MKIFNNWPMIILLCVTLGLAPFNPEPHILGKIRWIAGGGDGMKPVDWFDTLLHGIPWILFFRLLFLTGFQLARRSKS